MRCMLTLPCFTAAACAQTPAWFVQYSTGAGGDTAVAVAALAGGGAYVAGTVGGDLAGPSAGFNDAFLARVDRWGARVWTRQIGAAGSDRGRSLALDDVGGVFVAGTMSDGPTGAQDCFLAHYDGAGTRLWFQRLELPVHDEIGWLAADGTGGFFLAGNGPLPGPSLGSYDCFVARYDSAGGRLWIRQFGTTSWDWATSAAPDGAGGVYIAGYSDGRLGGSVSGHHSFLARYDADGNQLWVRQLASDFIDEANAVARDPSGGAFIAGYTNGRMTPGPFGGGMDAYIARFDGSGSLTWVRQIDASDTQRAWAVTPAPQGGAFLFGSTSGTLQAPSYGQVDAFFARYAADGSRLAILQFGTPFDDQVLAAESVGGSAYVAGEGPLGGPLGGAFIGRLSACYANCDDSSGLPVLTVNDFMCFLQQFAVASAYPNCDGSTTSPTLNIQDFTCFLNRFAAGCP